MLRWTAQEDAVIWKFSGLKSIEEVTAMLPGREVGQVRRRAATIGCAFTIMTEVRKEARAALLREEMLRALLSCGYTAAELQQALVPGMNRQWLSRLKRKTA